jgi:hypothetical protein
MAPDHRECKQCHSKTCQAVADNLANSLKVLYLVHHLLVPDFLLEDLPATPVGSIRRLWMGPGRHGPIWHTELGRNDGVPILPRSLRTRLWAWSPLPVLVFLPAT